MKPQAPHQWVKVVERLCDLGEQDQALAKVLPGVLKLSEAEAVEMDGGVAPWAYWRTASLLRARGDVAGELKVLRRFAAQPHAPGRRTEQLLARLARLERKAS